MDSNFQKCIFLAPFPLTSAHVLVALLVNKVSSMVLYPFLRLWTTSPAKAHFPRNLDVKSANNSGTTHSGEKTIPYYGMQLYAWTKNTTFCSYTIYSIPPYEHGAYLKPRRSERTRGG